MSNFSRKVTSALSVLAFTATTLSSSVTAYAASEFVAYAEVLASNGVISAQSTEAGYRLADNITRAEITKIAVNLAGLTPTECAGNVFSDVSSKLGDLCGYIEAAAEAGIVSTANANFRPTALVTRAELVKILLGAVGEEGSDTSAGYSDVPASLGDLYSFVNRANELGVIASATYFRPTATATRGEAFKIAAGAAGLEISTEEPTDPETPTNTGVTLAGDVSVALSSATPASATIPASVAGVVVAKYEITAASSDVTVNSIKVKRVGLSDSDTLTALALSVDGVGRVSKSKNENSSDDTADFALSSPLVVKAGSSVTVNVLASLNTAANAANDEFAIQVVALGSTAENVSIGATTSNTFRVGSVNAAGITVDNDGSSPAVKVGEVNKEIYKFKVVNGSNDEDMTLSAVTLKEIGTADDMVDVANWTLYLDGTQVAKTTKSSDKYVTFTLTTPATLKSGKTNKFVVKADVVGGAGKTLQLVLDSTLDVTAAGTKYGYGAGVTNNTGVGGSTVTIQAGEVVLSLVEAPADKIKENKKDVVLGKIIVNNVAGKNLELRKALVQIARTAGVGNVSGYLENVELYDETRGTLYDLTASAPGATETYSDADLNITLPAGITTFAVRADTKNLSALTSPTLAQFGAASFVLSVPSIGAAGTFQVVETEDDQAVTDITPSTLTFKKVDGSLATATATVLPLSTTKTAVIGSKDVEALNFEVKADSSSALKLNEVRVTGTPATATLNNTRVTELKLYKGSVATENLLDRVSASNLASEVATFDGFNVAIAKNGTQKFVVTVSVVDTFTAADDVRLAVSGLEMDDEDNDDVYANGDTSSTLSSILTSARTITISNAGTLATVADNTDTETDKSKNVLANSTTPFVASFELTAQNEGVKIKDLSIVAGGAAVANFVDAVSEVVLVKGDKTTEIARKSVTTSTVSFDDVNYTVAEGSENIYVKLVTRKIGKDEAGIQTGDLTLALNVTDAEGAASNKVVANPAQTAASLAFAVVPVRVSNVALVSSANGVSVATSLSNGSNNVAIIAVTTDTSSNLNNNGAGLKTNITSVAMDIEKLAATTVGGYTLEKIGGTELPVAGVVAGSVVTFNVASFTADDLVNNGSTVYYVVKATGVAKNNTSDKDDYIQAKFNALNAGQVTYTADTAVNGQANVTDLRLGSVTKLDGVKVSE